MITLAEARDNIGRGVVYNPESGSDPVSKFCVELGYGRDRLEDGVITGVSGSYVFVRYASDQHSKATDPRQLTFLT